MFQAEFKLFHVPAEQFYILFCGQALIHDLSKSFRLDFRLLFRNTGGFQFFCIRERIKNASVAMI